jgi:hypothetical protein
MGGTSLLRRATVDGSDALFILQLLAATSATYHHQTANKTGICRKRAEIRFILSHQSTLGGISLLRRATVDGSDALFILQSLAATSATYHHQTANKIDICSKRAEIRFILSHQSTLGGTSLLIRVTVDESDNFFILQSLAATSATYHHQTANKTDICSKRAEIRFILSHQSTLGGTSLLRRVTVDGSDSLFIL